MPVIHESLVDLSRDSWKIQRARDEEFTASPGSAVREIVAEIAAGALLQRL